MFVHGDRLEGRVDGDEDSDDIAPVGRRNRLTASLSAVREIEEGGGGHLVCQTEVLRRLLSRALAAAAGNFSRV